MDKFSRRSLVKWVAGSVSGLFLFPTETFGIKSNNSIPSISRSKKEDFFLNEDFMLQSDSAVALYHDYAKNLPIIDFHSHLPPSEIANNCKFENLTKIWLDGDHYKMRAMRANGVDERYITGDASDMEKFSKWAETIPYTIMNPLFHWTHMELKNYFGIQEILNTKNSARVYSEANGLLQRDDFRSQPLIKKMNVEVLCTTDDPTDDLKHHQDIRSQSFSTKVLPAWRPDKILKAEVPIVYNQYLDQLSKVTNINISKYRDLIDAIKKRQILFNNLGCRLSDHGIEKFYADEYTTQEIEKIFEKIRSGKFLTHHELSKLKSSLLYDLASMNYDFGWTQQFHFGPLRNNNTKMFNKLGPDKGYDSIGDFQTAKEMSTFLDRLELSGKLTKSIFYNLNPKDNEMVATMIGNFNDGSIPGKMQYGSAWWFLDQKNGIESQLMAIATMGLLGRFVGMTTDSRSFLSYSRHEYFRRVLCNLLGNEISDGRLPNDLNLIGQTVQNICYYNAKTYFSF